MPCGTHFAHRLELVRRVLPLRGHFCRGGSELDQYIERIPGELRNAAELRSADELGDGLHPFAAAVAAGLLNYAVFYAAFHAPTYVLSGNFALHFGRLAGVVRGLFAAVLARAGNRRAAADDRAEPAPAPAMDRADFFLDRGHYWGHWLLL